jgi:SAM-dependent methyltransferase
LDISKPLLDRAIKRANDEGVNNTAFLLADAQSYRFDHAYFDVLVSRIGMSFFEDSVGALRNLVTSLKQGGRMAFVCWAEAKRNPWFKIPKQAAEARLGIPPPSDSRLPGPTAFQEIEYVVELMTKAGLKEGRGTELEVWLTPPDGVRGAARVASSVGPAARVMKAFNGGETDASAIEDDVAASFSQYDHGGVVRVPAVINLFTGFA